MDMLAQDNLGMVNIESVAAEHDITENLRLLFNFFPLAYDALKPDAFLVLWADYMVWQQLYDWAKAAGFKVQRWPIIWVKTHTCQNAAAQYNFTKTTELAMVCRKGNATLTRIGAPGHIIASHDEYKESMDHPFVKPFSVWEHLVLSCTLEGQTILDPFAGEMSGPISFLRCNRNYFACEKNEVHFNKGMENIKDYYRRINPDAQFI
jgi:DNA modification methylase